MLAEENFKDVPAYYPTMYLDGFTPEQILYAKKKQMLEDIEERENPDPEIKITSEVKIK